ncbi:SDR family oxidoreductase [Phreatobacter aquaticus]|uniref:SDR family oxidoreductase n=1 Tax=Phreatobacter aquaticus TaxID=2570229 RepID=A0A4D7QV48_9HYPH|nr:SDR family oxidoreductase [Phreatobacter aquaticus]QCK87842.1 SDR family oxidoreductase [Phreatobacter aquaticus]
MPVIIVTGAAGNVGSAIVKVLGDGGSTVIAVDRGTGIDLMDPASCEKLVADTLARHGRIDGVIHTVGGFAWAPIADSAPELWEKMFRLNTLTTLNIFRAAIVPMRAAGRGSLAAIAAGAGLKAGSGMAAYAASKAGVIRMVESFAEELKPEGIRVNAILPGTIDTPQNRADMPDADVSKWVQPAEVAEAVAYLLSDRASGITGAALPVSGRG